MKLTRFKEMSLIIVLFAYLIVSGYCVESSEKSMNLNANKVTNSNSNTNKVESKEKSQEGIFMMKHKKLRTTTTATSKKSTTQVGAKKATTTTASANTNKKATTGAKNGKKQSLETNLNGASSELLKSTNMLDAANDALGNKNVDNRGFKKRIDLAKLGPITYHGWVKFFKYQDQAATDKKAKQVFNKNKKFFINSEFREQLKLYPGENYSEKGDDGEFKYISNPQDFYLVAFKSSVVFYQTKMVNKIKTFFIFHRKNN